MWRHRMSVVVIAICSSGSVAAEDRYFPPDVFDRAFQMDDFSVAR